MIHRVVINNFKKFEHLELDLPAHLVIAGPNNSGKTTLFQAIAAWSEFAFQWLENNPDLAREEDGNYPQTNLNLLRFYSVPLADFDHLWKDKHVQESASVWLHTNQWKIGFEIVYKETELAVIRPAKDVNEDDLERYINDPLIPIYIPPLSGVDIIEPSFDSAIIPYHLARAQAGSILRNLLLAVNEKKKNWAKLQDVMRDFFGYELDSPSGGAQIYARYRHSTQDQNYDISSAASGFLQVLMIYAALLARKASVLLIDEPDAHLHILLQNKMYCDLRDYARQSGSQLIIATHSESLINIVEPHHLCILLNQPRMIADKAERSALITALTALDNMDIILAYQMPGILYVEGYTDIAILRTWAKKLNHRLLSFLEKPFWKPTVYETHHQGTGIKAERHFEALKLVKQDILGIELLDRDKRSNVHAGLKILHNGLARIYWQRYEIESYLIHSKSIVRFVKSVSGQEAANRADNYMQQQLPRALYENPFSPSDYDELVSKPKNILSKIMQNSGIDVRESEYYQIAEQMTQEEIHPEVEEKLDAIADHFNI